MIYFDSNVWGTVSDWSMVFVMVISAYYLYKTLKSQKEVQETQNKLFEIENIRFRESIKPIFKFSLSDHKFHPSGEDKIIYTFEMINVSNNSALEIFVINQDTPNVKRIVTADFPRKHIEKGDTPWLIHFLSNNKRFGGFMNFSVVYSDINGNRYQQNVLLILEHENTQIIPFPPEIVNKKSSLLS